MPKLTLEVLTTFRDRSIAAYNDQPTVFRLEGMDRDLNEHEKINLAHLDAAVLTLRSLDPDLVNMELLNALLSRDYLIVHDINSVFGD